MDGFIHAWQNGVMWVCFGVLGIMAVGIILYGFGLAWDKVREWWSLPCIERVLVGVFVLGFAYYGATKQGWHVGYDGGIKAGATANVVTNDTVSIHWQRDTSGGVYVPESAVVYIDYRPNTETNAEWGLLAQTTVGAWGWSGTVENATNYDYNVWAYYIPPEPVHTNGVWTYKTHFDRSGEYALPLRARVEVNGVAIATPAEKRKDTTLPYDSEVEYLESSGMQWVDTGVVANGEFDADYTISTPSSFRNFIVGGARSATQHLNFGQYEPNGNFIMAYLGSYWTALTTIAPNTTYTARIHYASGSQTATVNGTAASSGSNSGTESLNLNIYLFKRNFYGASDTILPMTGKMYSFKIWQNGVLVRDYIPVRVGTTGELYDRVSKTLATRHGDFQYGQDVVPVEYIESHGTEYIDTGVNIDNSAGFVVDYEYTKTYTWLIGGRTSSGAAQCDAWMPTDSILRLAYGSSSHDVTTTKGRHVLSMIDGVAKLDGNVAHTFPSQTFSTTSKILLCNLAINSSSTPSSIPFIGKMFSCDIYKGSALAQKLIPVRVGTEGAMMNTLTRRIYRNAGTGSFGYGSDK